MNRIILFLAFILSTSAFAQQAKQTKVRRSNRDYVINLDIGSTPTNVITANGTTGAITIGAASTGVTQTLNGNVNIVAVLGGNPTTAGQLYIGGVAGQTNLPAITGVTTGNNGFGIVSRSSTDSSGGIGMFFLSQTTASGALASNAPFKFINGATTTLVNAADGSWTFGSTTNAATDAITIIQSSASAVTESAIKIAPGAAGQVQPIRWYDTDDNEQWSIGMIGNSGSGFFGFWNSSGSGNTDISTAVPTLQVRAGGGIETNGGGSSVQLGAAGGTRRAGIWMDFFSTSTNTCAANACAVSETAHGFNSASGVCLAAWNQSTGAPLAATTAAACTDATNVPKICLCAGANL